MSVYLWVDKVPGLILQGENSYFYVTWFYLFWYWLSWVVPFKRPLNGCVFIYATIYSSYVTYMAGCSETDLNTVSQKVHWHSSCGTNSGVAVPLSSSVAATTTSTPLSGIPVPSCQTLANSGPKWLTVDTISFLGVQWAISIGRSLVSAAIGRLHVNWQTFSCAINRAATWWKSCCLLATGLLNCYWLSFMFKCVSDIVEVGVLLT